MFDMGRTWVLDHAVQHGCTRAHNAVSNSAWMSLERHLHERSSMFDFLL